MIKPGLCPKRLHMPYIVQYEGIKMQVMVRLSKLYPDKCVFKSEEKGNDRIVSANI